MTEPILEIQDLSFSYEAGGGEIFSHLNLRVEEGEFLLVKGPSGMGKSTLLRLICRLQQPRSGIIRYRGREITLIAPSVLRSSISFVAQIPKMTDASVRDNLLLPFSFAVNKAKTAPSDESLELMLRNFYLESVSLSQSAMKLSIGQMQRLAIMRAILLNPDILLLDEPTSALDPESAAMVFSLIERLNIDEGKTLITVTHSDYAPKLPRAAIYRLHERTLHREER
ncbi:ATP-binding cassette domain-containing protein [Chlorobium phaeovibrioides]|uniref:ATP-binding cassette domain-containing protein n=1 Tax=Chlorobium phaeovibrioides TaxID=1094 RepID=A0A5M8IAU6_CHLPH|nr:ABC transporter ATP-binding protein [Chlorobium phaeovibrioides]KAA6232553.1 ATP-binding cassette domain-containing protein [Chlorobium phaeovibrioides]